MSISVELAPKCSLTDMDYTEALEAAISKRKYLLNSLFDLEHFPKDTELTEDNDFSYEARKRKYCENWYT